MGSDGIPNDVDTTILTLNNVPAGSYVVTAKATLETTDGDLMQCNLENGGNSVDQTQWSAPTAADLDAPMTLTAVVNVTNGPLSIECSKDGTTDGLGQQREADRHPGRLSRKAAPAARPPPPNRAVAVVVPGHEVRSCPESIAPDPGSGNPV